MVKLAWKNIWHKPWQTVLSLVLISSGIAVVVLVSLLQKQFETRFTNDLKNVDMVLGAKGSPLQLVLSSVYHVDAPTGNIDFHEAERWMHHRDVARAVPLAFGDNFKGFKIVGTEASYFEHYKTGLSSGRYFKADFEVVVGSETAKKLGLKLGNSFHGAHGDAEEGEEHTEYDYTVTGILAPTGGVSDNLILCTIPSVWAMHGGHSHEESETTEHARETHEHADDEQEHAEHAETNEAQEITAVLISFKSKMAFVMWPRLVPETSNMQAALPAVEINRLFTLMGVGFDALHYIALGIILIAGLSIFVSLFSRLSERKYEFALLRMHGASRFRIFSMVILESLFLCVTGFVIGSILGRAILWFISKSTDKEYKFSLQPFSSFGEKELVLLLCTLAVGILAAILPAIKVYRYNISKILSDA